MATTIIMTCKDVNYLKQPKKHNNSRHNTTLRVFIDVNEYDEHSVYPQSVVSCYSGRRAASRHTANNHIIKIDFNDN